MADTCQKTNACRKSHGVVAGGRQRDCVAGRHNGRRIHRRGRQNGNGFDYKISYEIAQKAIFSSIIFFIVLKSFLRSEAVVSIPYRKSA